MIKLEHVVLASPEQMEFIIEGMRNPMNSWEKSDSEYLGCEIDETDLAEWFKLGKNDHSLMQCLSYAGTEHRKFMRMMPVYVRITAPLYWWKEFDTYKVGTVANSCSTMHKIQAKEFKLEDFSHEHMDIASETCLETTIGYLNLFRQSFLENPLAEVPPFVQLMILTRFINIYQHLIIHHNVARLVITARKKLNYLPPNILVMIEELPYSELITGGVE